MNPIPSIITSVRGCTAFSAKAFAIDALRILRSCGPSLAAQYGAVLGSSRSRLPLPWITLVLGALSLGISLSPAAAVLLTPDRSFTAVSDWGRRLTGNFVHWNLSHLAWDLAVFLVLGIIAESSNRKRYVSLVALAGLICPMASFLLMPEITSYRGLSGIDTALFVSVALSLRRNSGTPRARASIDVILALFVAKTLMEFFSHKSLFVGELGEQVIPVPAAHVTGALAGFVVHAIGMRSRTKRDDN